MFTHAHDECVKIKRTLFMNEKGHKTATVFGLGPVSRA